MAKELRSIVIVLVLIIACFLSGYWVGYNRTSGSGASSDSQVSRIVELTREYLVRERENLANERDLVKQQRIQLESDRAEFEQERTLYNKQRELAVSDREDLNELTRILEQIRSLAQSKE